MRRTRSTHDPFVPRQYSGREWRKWISKKKRSTAQRKAIRDQGTPAEWQDELDVFGPGEDSRADGGFG